jgi:hypothetical protein
MKHALCSVALLAACGGAAAPNAAAPAAPDAPSAPYAGTDALWRMAPAQATTGIAISGEAAEALVTTLALAHASDPALVGRLEAFVGAPSAALRDREALRRSGVEVRRGAALFRLHDEAIVLVGVSDEAAFRAGLGASLGTCRAVRGYMACSHAPAALDEIGADPDTALVRAAAEMPTGYRGNVQLLHVPFEHGIPDVGVVGALQVTRGAVEGRLLLRGDQKPFPVADRTPLARSLDGADVGGAVVLDLRQVLTLEYGLGAMLGDAATMFRGDAVLVVPPGDEPRARLRVPLKDPGTVRSLLAGCSTLARDGLSARPKGAGCELTLTQLPIGPVTGFAQIVDGELRIDLGAAATSRAPLPDGVRAVFSEAWTLAAWSRVETTALSGATSTLPTELRAMVSAAVHLDEIGVAQRSTDDGTELWLRVGTVWRNSDAVLAEVEPILARFESGPILEEVRAVARRHPGSPLAAAAGAGPYGGIVVTGFAALVASFSVQPVTRTFAGVSAEERADRVVDAYVFEAYTQWSMRNAAGGCPTMAELDVFMPAKDTRDPWGRPYELVCGAGRTRSALGIEVFSRGPDGVADTDDDVRSMH